MMRLCINIIFSITLLSCGTTPENYTVALPPLPADESAFQKMVIAHLSGEKPIPLADGGEIQLKSRWSAEERLITLSYVGQLMGEIGAEPVTHPYRYRNINPAVDLLIEPLCGTNLYTLLPATVDSDEYVILGAHFDTGAMNVPGAIDNASGVALVLSVLRKASGLTFRNKHLVFAVFDQEEEELVGSAAFAEYVATKEWQVHSVHTFDMVGWDGDGNREVELELPAPHIEEVYSRAAGKLGIPLYTTRINSTDHYSFIKKGFSAVGVSQAYAKGDNSGKKDTPEDKYHLVNFEYLGSTTSLAMEVITEIVSQ